MLMNIRTILANLICIYFPELQDTYFEFVIVRNKDYYMAISKLPFKKKYTILIDEEILRFSLSAFKACLAHELCHIHHLKSLNFLQRAIYTLRWMIFSKYKISQEVQMDRNVQRRGLSRELSAFHQEYEIAQQRYMEMIKLTKKEILQLGNLKGNCQLN